MAKQGRNAAGHRKPTRLLHKIREEQGSFNGRREKDVNERGALFSRLAKNTAVAMGHPGAFIAASFTILMWALSGPLFGFSDTWQLVINTGTTIVTFLMVFLIQNSQNRDSCAIQVKLDELIRSTKGAHNALLDLEELNQQDLDKFIKLYQGLAQEARRRVQAGTKDTNTPDVKEG